MSNKKVFVKEEIIRDLQSAGIKKGDCLNLKVSMRSIGALENGASTLIDALIEVVGEEGLLVAAAFVPTQKNNDSKVIVNQNTKSSSGAFANAMVEHKLSYRSLHPVQKFAVIGKRAKELTTLHNKDAFAYQLFRDLIELKGKNVNIDLNESIKGFGTTHVALCDLNYEQLRPKKGVYFQSSKDEVDFFEVNWVGGCSKGFSNLMPTFEKEGAILYKGGIAQADITITDMQKTYAIEMREIAKNPKVILCEDDNCFYSRASWSFSDEKPLNYLINQLTSGNFKKFLQGTYLWLTSKKIKG